MFSGEHIGARRRKRGGGKGGDSPPPPKFQVAWGGIAPPNFAHCFYSELHCSIGHCSSFVSTNRRRKSLV